ncbi:hypothetical protein BLL42_26030 [Pseudomonas frederiksbergensis]|uniref:DUF2790 domain-containing protein n=1 Tax=Pseudomonas frederiksbergensis TaxID=104087 RepID=A0A1J0ESV1_9PSED|nr:DUF2790 domain-containing protein [Pseudomonas frederiksbergensis]APC18991.1 hypothetical protein BLL42_26030 [Pseudomonas frederiksbergensis]
MNMRILLVASALACTGFAGLALADSAPSQPVPYHYGMPLHVNKVISMTEPTTQDCKVVTAEMRFIDNVGKQEDISYLKLSDACHYQN